MSDGAWIHDGGKLLCWGLVQYGCSVGDAQGATAWMPDMFFFVVVSDARVLVTTVASGSLLR